MKPLLLAAALAAVLSTAALAQGSATPALDDAARRSLYLGVIDSLRGQGMTHAALAHLDSFERQNPHDPRAQVLRADCLVDLEAFAAAEAIYRALASGPVAAQAEAGLGRIQARRGQWAGAVAAFAKAVALRPTHAPYLNDLGFALLKAGRTEEARFRLRQAAELAPEDPLVRNNLQFALSVEGASP